MREKEKENKKIRGKEKENTNEIYGGIKKREREEYH